MKLQYIDADEVVISEDEGSVHRKKWLFRMLRLWPWFLFSLLVSLSVAFLYLHYYATPIYRAVASVMVKDEKKGAELMDNSRLKEIGLGSNSKLVENEIEILKSYDLMEEVVDSLQLFLSVKHVGRIRNTVVAFGDDIPFTIEIINPEDIRNTRHWIVTDTVNAVLFQSEYDKHPYLLQYGQIYKSGAVRFRCLPGAPYPDSPEHKVDSSRSNYKVDISSPNQTAIRYSKKLSVEAASKSATVINLEMEDTNQERAAAILQTLIAIYNQQGLEDKNRVTDNTIDFLNDRLVTVATELGGTEGSVEKFKSENRVTDLSADAQQYLEISQQVDAQKAQSQTQLNIVSALVRDLELNQENPQLVPSTLGILEPSLGLLIEKHNDLVLQKERMQQKSGPKNPLVIDQQNQIRELRSKLLTNVRNLKKAYTISRDDISRKDAQLNNRIRTVPQLEKKLVQITRNQNVQEQLYAFLLQKREEAAVSRASNIEDSRTIVQARGLGVVSPKTTKVWALGILMGIMLPVALISLKDFMNNKVGDVTQVEQRTDMPLLGIISHVKKLKSPVVIDSLSRSAVAEQIRNIRTSIGLTGKNKEWSFSGKIKEVQTILVTSFQPGDGKSFVSLNLAAGYALLNKKTVMLEFDLRRPHISKDLGLDVQEGISSILTGKSALDDLLVEVQEYEGHLFLLPAGYLATNPAELISGPKMPCLIKMLRERFDYIIINTPPFSIITDATLLQKYADITLIVLRQDHTSRDVYTELKHRVARHPDNPVYLLLNDVGKRKRYQQRGYGYAKGYYH